MKDHNRETLEASRPQIPTLQAVEFCCRQLEKAPRDKLPEKVALRLTAEELLGGLLLARDAAEAERDRSQGPDPEVMAEIDAAFDLLNDEEPKEQEEAAPVGPTVPTLWAVNYCLQQLFNDHRHGIRDEVCHHLTYEEVIGALLLARDDAERLEAAARPVEEEKKEKKPFHRVMPEEAKRRREEREAAKAASRVRNEETRRALVFRACGDEGLERLERPRGRAAFSV